jgi:hypothetical protein
LRVAGWEENQRLKIKEQNYRVKIKKKLATKCTKGLATDYTDATVLGLATKRHKRGKGWGASPECLGGHL